MRADPVSSVLVFLVKQGSRDLLIEIPLVDTRLSGAQIASECAVVVEPTRCGLKYNFSSIIINADHILTHTG